MGGVEMVVGFRCDYVTARLLSDTSFDKLRIRNAWMGLTNILIPSLSMDEATRLS